MSEWLLATPRPLDGMNRRRLVGELPPPPMTTAALSPGPRCLLEGSLLSGRHRTTNLAVGFESLATRIIASRDSGRRPAGDRLAPGTGLQPRPRGQWRQLRAGQRALDNPGRRKTGTGAAGLPSNEVTGGSLASRPGLARRPPRNRHRDYCGMCRPCRRPPTSRSAWLRLQ
jgi:hypothetical protein